MAGRLVWIDAKTFRGFGCSDCNWRYSVHENSDPECLLVSCARFLFDAHECMEHPFPGEADPDLQASSDSAQRFP
jgi:hypothetical protein